MSLRPTSHSSHSWGGSSESHPAFIWHRDALRRPESTQGTTVCDKSRVAVQPLEAPIADAAAVPPKRQLQWAVPSTAAPTIGSTRAGTAEELTSRRTALTQEGTGASAEMPSSSVLPYVGPTPFLVEDFKQD